MTEHIFRSNDDIVALCQKIIDERDSNKLILLVGELNDILARQNPDLKSSRPPASDGGTA